MLSLSIVIGVTSLASIAKVIRTEVRQIRNSKYVVASKRMGLPLEIISWGSMLSLSEKALLTDCAFA